MLEGYVSEKEQLEEIRKWWHQHGKMLFIAIVIGLLIGLVWRQWHKLSIQRADNAAMLYQQILDADATKQSDKATAGVAILEQHYTNTPYASLGALLAAKNLVIQNNLPKALVQLQWVIDHSKNARLENIARIDAARVLLAEKQPAKAKAVLAKIKDKPFVAVANWVRGDIATQAGDKKAAQQYYTEAKNGLNDVPPAQTVLSEYIAN